MLTCSKKLSVFLSASYLVGMLLVPCQPLRGAEQPVAPATIAPEKQGEMEKVRLTEIQDGVKKWVLTADNADYLKDKDRIYIKQVWVEVFGPNQDVATDDIIITGDSGFINVKSRDLILEGNVHAKSAEYEFTSDLVHYNPQTRVLSAPGPVKVQGSRLYVEGKGMTVDLKNHKLDLAQHTVTKLHVPGKLWNH
jgi:LPS export ABC transporter protein LptC